MPDPAHSDRYDQTLLSAAQLHRGQRRKGAIGDRITQHQQAAFIDHVLEECEEQGLDGAAAPAET